MSNEVFYKQERKGENIDKQTDKIRRTSSTTLSKKTHNILQMSNEVFYKQERKGEHIDKQTHTIRRKYNVGYMKDTRGTKACKTQLSLMVKEKPLNC